MIRTVSISPRVAEEVALPLLPGATTTEPASATANGDER
jgi:hypothetical protein